MRYTQSQIRDLLFISVDAFRAWRKAIPALTVHKGHAPSYTPGNVVAMAIVAELVRDFGVRVGTVGDRFDRLFKERRGKSWLSLESCIALIEVDGIRLVNAGTSLQHSPDTSTLCVPCAPIVSRLRLALTASEVEQIQGHLQFPPPPCARNLNSVANEHDDRDYLRTGTRVERPLGSYTQAFARALRVG